MFLAAWACFGAVGVLAATTSDSPAVGVGTLAVQLGLSAVFLWQWRDERNVRVRREDQLIEILERSSPVLAQAVDTLKEVQEAQRMTTLSVQDWHRATDEMHRTAEALRDELRSRRQ